MSAPEPAPRQPGRTVAEALEPRTEHWALLVDDGVEWIVDSSLDVSRRYATWPEALAAYEAAERAVLAMGAT